MLPSHGSGALPEPAARDEPETADGPKGSLGGLGPTSFRPGGPLGSRIAYPRVLASHAAASGKLVSIRSRQAFEAELEAIPEQMEPMAKTRCLGLVCLRPVSG